MDCYFHPNVPSVAPCKDCMKPICATCRDDAGTCPSCRLAAKMHAATGTRQAVAGEVRRPSSSWWQSSSSGAPAPQPRAPVATADPPETRAMVALGYPLWPVALLSLLDRSQSRRMRKHAYQALGFNLGMSALFGFLYLFRDIPLLDFSVILMLGLMLPAFVVLAVYFGIRAWHGEDVRIPIISDWLDDRMPA